MLSDPQHNEAGNLRVLLAPSRDTGGGAAPSKGAKLTPETLISYLENGEIEAFNAARTSSRGRLDLSGIQSLAGKNLTGANLSRVVLVNANLANTILDFATCVDADLSGAIMDGVSAREADLTKARMLRTSCRKGKFAANFENAVMVETNLAGASLDAARFTHANMERSILFQCRGKGIVFEKANLIEANATLSMFDETTSFKGAYIRDLKHSGFACKASLLTEAISDQDPPPGTFKVSAPEVYESRLINGIIGTDRDKYEQAMGALESLIGLSSVKRAVYQLLDSVQMEQQELLLGLPEVKINQHYAFTGAPGTGKTTVARLFGQLLHSLGYLEKGHVVEVSRKDLVGEFKGHTAPLTYKKVVEAFGGILFIDEAYSLFQDDKDNFGKESMETLLKAMEDHSGQFVVILAGYTDRMKQFIDTNPGLESRVSDTIEFPSYASGELSEIYDKMLSSAQRVCDGRFLAYSNLLFAMESAKNLPSFGNGRFVRNVFTDTILNQRSRNAEQLRSGGKVKKEAARLVLAEDIPFEPYTGRSPSEINIGALRWIAQDGTEYTWKDLRQNMKPFPVLSPDCLKELMK